MLSLKEKETQMINKNKEKICSFAIMLIGLILGIMAVYRHLGEFSPDSYSYYDISRTFFSDFGHVNTIRQYVVKSEYNCSFPYVFPFLIYLVDKITNLRIYSSVVVNIFIMSLTAVLFLYWSNRFAKNWICGGITAALLMTNSAYLEEVYAGRSIPLAILLLFAVVALLFEIFQRKSSFYYMNIILTGLLAGLSAMTRFDEISLVMFLIPVLLYLAPKEKKIKTLLIYLLFAGVAFVPWCIYCLKHFNTLYFTDNNGTIWNISAEVPSYVYLPDEKILTFWNSSGLWIKTLWHNLRDTFLCAEPVFRPLIQVVLLFFLIDLCKKAKKQKNIQTGQFLADIFKINKLNYQLIIISGVYLIAKFFVYAVVGYVIQRYYIEVVFLFMYIVIQIIYKQSFKEFHKISVIASLTVLCLHITMHLELFLTAAEPFEQFQKNNVWVEELNTALTEASASPEDSILTIGADIEGFPFGVLTSHKTYVSPVNISPQTVEYVLDNYADSVKWVALSINESDDVRQMLKENYPEIACESFYLYAVS